MRSPNGERDPDDQDNAEDKSSGPEQAVIESPFSVECHAPFFWRQTSDRFELDHVVSGGAAGARGGVAVTLPGLLRPVKLPQVVLPRATFLTYGSSPPAMSVSSERCTWLGQAAILHQLPTVPTTHCRISPNAVVLQEASCQSDMPLPEAPLRLLREQSAWPGSRGQ